MKLSTPKQIVAHIKSMSQPGIIETPRGTLTINYPENFGESPHQGKPRTAQPSAYHQAVTLYKSETLALSTIRRHLITQKTDLDPSLVKRAEKLCTKLEAGHDLKESSIKAFCPKTQTWLNDETVWKIKGKSAKLLYFALKGTDLNTPWPSDPSYTLDESEKTDLLEKGYILNVI
jgi:hypothetical protein